MIEELKQNIETEIEVLREISNNIRRLDYASPSERKLLATSVESLRSSMKMINGSLPRILEDVTIATKLPQRAKTVKLEKVEFNGVEGVVHVTLKTEDREVFLKQLSVSESLLKKLKRKQLVQEDEKYEELKAARGYLKMSNKFFLDRSVELIKKNYFSGLSIELKKANIDVLFASYVAMILFTTLLSFFASLILVIFFFVFDITLSSPFLIISESMGFVDFVKLLWIPIVIPIATFLILYYYPSTEKDSLAKKIDQELPFAVIHMSSISGSGIEPSEIFKIIGLSREYPYLRKEIRKILNQVNLYGYDLVTALSNVSKTTPSTKLSELFSGVSTTMTSGGNLSDFFAKRSEGLLTSYRLDREKYVKTAETFMDIYISIVIAAPMILMILLVMISVSNFETGFTLGELTAGVLGVIAVINCLFLTFLHLKQPIY